MILIFLCGAMAFTWPFITTSSVSFYGVLFKVATSILVWTGWFGLLSQVVCLFGLVVCWAHRVTFMSI
jgi:uncharacterized membrane protein